MNDEVKTHGIVITLSTIATLIPVVAATWFIIKPAVIEAVATDIVVTVDSRIDTKTEPLAQAFKVLLKTDIDKLKVKIARLEYRRTRDTNWTVELAQELAEAKVELESLEKAYNEL